MIKKLKQRFSAPFVKRLFKIGLILLSVVLVLMLVGYGLLQTPVVQRALKGQVIKIVETNTGARLKLDRLSGNLLSRLSLHGLQLSFDGNEILSADRIDMVYSLPMLFNKTLWINRLRFDGVRLTAVQKPDGSWNLSDIFAAGRSAGGPSTHSPTPASSFQLTIGQLMLMNSRVDIASDPAPPVSAIHIDQFRGGLTYEADGRLTAHIYRMAFAAGAPPLIRGVLDGQIRFDPDGNTLLVEALQIRTDASDLKLDGKLEAEGPEPKITADLSLSPLSIPEMARLVQISDFNRGVLKGDISLYGTTAKLNHRVRLRHRQQELALNGVVRNLLSGGLEIDTRGSVAHLDPLYWGGGIQNRPPSDLNAEFDFSGRHLLDARRECRLIVYLQASDIVGYSLTRGEFQAKYADARLEIGDSRLVTPLGRIEGTVQLSGLRAGKEKRAQAGFRLDAVDLGRFWLPEGLETRITGEIRVEARGPLDPRTDWDIGLWTAGAEAEMHSLMVAGAAVEDVSIRTKWDGRSLSVGTFRLKSDLVTADVRGHIEPAEGSLRFTGDTAFTDLEQLADILQRMKIVDLDQWAPQGGLNLSGTVSRNDQHFRIEADGRSRRLTIAGVSLSKPRLTGNIAFGPSGISGNLDGSLKALKAQGQQVNGLKLDSRISDRKIAARLSARHDLGELTLAGHLSDWRNAAKTLQLNKFLLVPSQPSKEGEGYGNIVNSAPVRILLAPGGLTVESLSLASEGGRLSVQGDIDYRGRHNLRIDIEKIRLARLNPVSDRFELPDGLLSADIDTAGTMAQPLIEGRLAVELNQGASDTGHFMRAAFDYERDTLTVEASLEENSQPLLDLKGQTGLELSFNPFSVRLLADSLAADIDVKGVRLSEYPLPDTLADAVDGLVSADVRATGDLLAPRLSGIVAVDSGRLNLTDYGLNFNNVSVDLALRPGVIEIKRCSMEGRDDGRLSAEGSLGIDGLTPVGFDVHLSGRRLRIPYKQAITAQIDPSLQLAGSLESPRLSGRIQIREARINLDRILQEGPSDIEVIREPEGDQIYEIQKGQPEKNGLFDRLAADLNVIADRNVWLKGQGLDAEIYGSIKVMKKAFGPARLTGRLEAERGFYDFYGKRFYITRGGVDFSGAPEPDPYIDITAETQIKDVTIVLNIIREEQRLQIEMSSRPPMTQSDIISYLVFGRPSDELRAQQSAGSDISALAISGKMAAAELERLLSQTGIVDTFTIDPGSEDITTGSASVGKYITRDIFVIYSYQFSADTPDEVLIDYHLNKNFSLKSQYGNEKTTGVDLIWQHDLNSLNPFSD